MITAIDVPDIAAEQDIVIAAVGNSFASPSSAREVGQTFPVSTNSRFQQVPLRLDGNRQVDAYTDFTSSFTSEWFATNDTGGATTYTITTIDGDNNVQAGQSNVDIVMTATTGVTSVTLGGETLTINGVS